MKKGQLIMTAKKRREFLNEHIPYRLAAIDLCQIVARLLGDGTTAHPIVIQFGSILTIKAGQARVFTNPVVEHGFMSCRAMLEFLGVGLDGSKAKLAAYRMQKPDTATLKDFTLELLTAEQVETYLAREPMLIDGLIRTIRAAHKAGAHLTTSGERLRPDSLEAGCRATRTLINHFLYEALGCAPPPQLVAADNPQPFTVP
jgi:hypothetical protein